MIQVNSGLNAREVVITQGGYGLEDGTHVQVSDGKQEARQ
jgi:hypothetical protein